MGRVTVGNFGGWTEEKPLPSSLSNIVVPEAGSLK